ncbi:TRAP transporter small permease subunit [Desulfosediminicola flagellatus]|uniref:TRAP transporter small permease subunit n=1 Tax=Desulfosediminicola flagellatus TaxID=2569541 RepID=UPI0010ABB685|nr:TRAP transporter small permease [Desulfosediminicola flagellatus]
MSSNTEIPRTITGQPMSRLDIWIVKLGNVVGWLYFVAVVISVFEVVMRYGFDRPTTWAHETTLMLVGIGMLWGGSYCMAEDRHIRVTVIRDAMGKKTRRIVDVIVGVLNLLFCAGLAWAGYLMTQKALFDPTGVFRAQRSGSAFNSPAPAVVKTVLFIVVALMTLQAIQQLWAKITLLRQMKSEKEHKAE